MAWWQVALVAYLVIWIVVTIAAWISDCRELNECKTKRAQCVSSEDELIIKEYDWMIEARRIGLIETAWLCLGWLPKLFAYFWDEHLYWWARALVRKDWDEN